jgi:hypothetical protein
MIKFELGRDPTMAVDFPDHPTTFLVSDVAGMINFMSVQSPVPLSSFQAFELTVPSSITMMHLSGELFFAGNIHGYVKMWQCSGTRMEEVRRFRAHTEAVIAMSYANAIHGLVTAGRDEEIRVWSLEPFALMGSLGKAWKWNSADPVTFLSTEPLPDDPLHFAEPVGAGPSPEAQELMALIAKQEGEIKESLDSVEMRGFSMERLTQGLARLDAQCTSGARWMKIALRRPDDMPRSARPKEPPRFSESGKELVDMATHAKTLARLEQFALKPRIWKPRRGTAGSERFRVTESSRS